MTRRDAKLKKLPERYRTQVVQWHKESGWQSCLQRIASELGIKAGKSALYLAMAHWEAGANFDLFEATAKAQAQLEAREKGGMTAEEMQEATDRYFIAAAAKAKDAAEYASLRYMRIADQSAKTNASIAKEKLRQKERQIGQKEEELKIAKAKFRRDTAELFVEWFANEQASKIMKSGASKTEKIERLGQAMFGEDW